MMTLIPAERHLRTGMSTPFLGGSLRETRPTKFKFHMGNQPGKRSFLWNTSLHALQPLVSNIMSLSKSCTESSILSSLEEDAKVVLNTLGLLHGRIHISDKKVELDVGGEVDLVKLVGGSGVSVDGVLITVLSNTTGGPASLVVNV